MKKIVLALAFLMPVAVIGQEGNTTIQIGSGYAHDFPGMDGYAFFGEIGYAMNSHFHAGFGLKWNNLHGYPRTKEVSEYTRAFGLDFNLYFTPINNENHQVKIGGGYSFSFYDARRSYPVVVNEGGSVETRWPIRDLKGRASGFNLLGEYAYIFPNTSYAIGARASLYKALDYVYFVGPFLGVKL